MLLSLTKGDGVGVCVCGGAELDGSCVNAYICSSCVVGKRAVSMRPSITCVCNLTYRRVCEHLCRTQCPVTLGFLVECWRSGGQPSLARVCIRTFKRAHKTCLTDRDVGLDAPCTNYTRASPKHICC